MEIQNCYYCQAHLIYFFPLTIDLQYICFKLIVYINGSIFFLFFFFFSLLFMFYIRCLVKQAWFILINPTRLNLGIGYLLPPAELPSSTSKVCNFKSFARFLILLLCMYISTFTTGERNFKNCCRINSFSM